MTRNVLLVGYFADTGSEKRNLNVAQIFEICRGCFQATIMRHNRVASSLLDTRLPRLQASKNNLPP